MSTMEGSERPFYVSPDSPPKHACQIGQRAKVTDLKGWCPLRESTIIRIFGSPPKKALRQQYQMKRHCSGSIKWAEHCSGGIKWAGHHSGGIKWSGTAAAVSNEQGTAAAVSNGAALQRQYQMSRAPQRRYQMSRVLQWWCQMSGAPELRRQHPVKQGTAAAVSDWARSCGGSI